MHKHITRRLLIFIICICTVCFIVMGVIINRSVAKIMMEQSQEDAMGIAVIAAKEIDGDAFEKMDSEDDENFQKTFEALRKYENFKKIRYMYTMKEKDGKTFFAVDADVDDPTPYGLEYPVNEEMSKAFSGEVACDRKFTEDEWGRVITGYAPIRNSKDEVVGIVGCDITEEQVLQPQRRVKTIVVAVMTIFSVLSLAFYLQMSYDLVSTDFLTDVANYERLIRRGKHLMKNKSLSGYTGILVNIKDFKYINESIGAIRGDQILYEYANRVEEYLKSREMIARTGNDNFMLLIKKGREQEIIDAISEMKIKLGEDIKTIHVYSRFGIYQIEPDITIQQVMTACTMALNDARGSNAPDVIWFEHEMMEQMIKDKEILDLFPEALKKEEFLVYYQPKVNMKTNQLYGGEALVRWFRDGKLIPPDSFIPVLERSTKITELDFYVFEKVCMNIRKWLDQGMEPVRISSNFSRMHLANPNFAQRILDTLEKYNVDPKYVEVELTESSGYSDFHALSDFIDLMKKMKIHTSIDDFGTGYTSLSLLKDLNVDVIKIDKSFFRNLESEDDAENKMVENVIHMIQDLNREVICEGVETEMQADFLKDKECFIAQGYLYDKPLQRSEFEERLRKPHYDRGKEV